MKKKRPVTMRRNLMYLALAATLVPEPLWAQTSLSAELRECSAIVGSVERLACYDGLARRPIPLPAQAEKPQPPLPPPAVAAADFGADTLPEAQPAPPPRSPLQSITAQVTDFSFDAEGHFIVTLSNGQVWREIEGDTVNARLRKDLTRTATISRAILRSYSISFNNPRGLFKVVRVR